MLSLTLSGILNKTLIFQRTFNSSIPTLSHFNSIATRSMSSHRLFQLKLDPLTGNSEWIVIEEEEGAFEISQRSSNLLATTSYLDMLNDSYRNKAFRMAIEKTITKPCHVLDIGAGTGLLSMIAARAMSCCETATDTDANGMVTACESYLPMVKLMRKVLHLNKMGSNITIINKRSDELKVGLDMPARADVLVSEILDSELLGEGLIPTLQHAHDMLLVKDPLTVPYRATTYGQLVESTFLWKLHDLYANEEKGLDSICLVPTGLDPAICVKQQQYPMHCDSISREIKLLSEPFKIFEFDFWKRPESHEEIDLLIKAIDDGRVHAVVSWWVLQLDREGTIFYSTAPSWISLTENTGCGNWRDHWKQCVWFVPGSIPISKGKEILLHATHSDTTITYDFQTETHKRQQYHKKIDEFELILPPERIGIYGDSQWRLSMLAAVTNALQEKVNPLCFVADDSVYLALLLARISKSTNILANFPGLRDKGAQYLLKVADANGVSVDRIEVLDRRKQCLTSDDIYQKQVDMFTGEPYYHGNVGALPWQNLRFWKERSMLDSVLADDAVILPCKGILKARAMSLPDVWKSRCCLGRIEEFDHSVVNSTLGACGRLSEQNNVPCLPYFIWQCGESKELSDTFTVMEFDFSKLISTCSGKVQIEFSDSGICHGFALWIDWVVDAKKSIIVSTGPEQRHWKQGLKLIAEPAAVGRQKSLRRNEADCYCAVVIDACFDPLTGELSIAHSFC